MLSIQIPIGAPAALPLLTHLQGILLFTLVFVGVRLCGLEPSPLGRGIVPAVPLFVLHLGQLLGSTCHLDDHDSRRGISLARADVIIGGYEPRTPAVQSNRAWAGHFERRARTGDRGSK